MQAWISLLRAEGRFLSFGLTTNMWLAIGQTYIFSLFNADIQRDLGLTNGEMATMFGITTIIGGVSLTPAGRLLDAMDLRVYMVVLLALTAISCAGMAEATTVPLLFVAMAGVRFFAGTLLGITAQASMARYFGPTRGRAASVANLGYTFGYAIFPVLVTSLMHTYGWRTTWAIFAGALLIGAIPLTLFQLRGHGERHRKYLERIAESASATVTADRHHYTLGEVLRDKRFYMVIPGMLAVPCLLFTFQYQQLAIVAEKGWDVKAFAAAYLLFSAFSLVANMIAGVIVDRYGSRWLMTIYLWPMVPALGLIAFADGAWAIPFYMIFSALTFGMNLVTAITLWSDLYGTRHIGAIRGFNAMLNTIVASAGIAATGFLIDRGVSLATQAAWGVLAIIAAAILLFVVGRRLPRRRAA